MGEILEVATVEMGGADGGGGGWMGGAFTATPRTC